MSLEVIELSESGELRLPDQLRDRHALVSGTRFVVLEHQNGLTLKPLETPPPKSLQELLAETQQQAQASGMTPEDIAAAISEVRSSR